MWLVEYSSRVALALWSHQHFNGNAHGRKSGLCSPLLLRDKPLDGLAGTATPPMLCQHWRQDSDRLHHVAEAQQALPRRMLIQADHWNPGRPITISVSLTSMPKIPWLLNEAKPLKDLAGSLAASWLESQL